MNEEPLSLYVIRGVHKEIAIQTSNTTVVSRKLSVILSITAVSGQHLLLHMLLENKVYLSLVAGILNSSK